MTPSLYRRVNSLVGELGLVNTLWYALAKAISKINLGRIYRYTIVSQSVRSDIQTPSRKGAVEIRNVSEADYQTNWFPRPATIIQDRFSQGAKCLVAFQGDKPIGCIWLIFDSYREDEINCIYMLQPANETAWDFDVYIHPDYRMGRTFSRIWDEAEKYLSSQGRQWSLSRIDAFNAVSLRSHQRRGAIIVGQLACLKVGNVQLLIMSIFPFLRLNWGNDSLPKISVNAPPKNKVEHAFQSASRTDTLR